MKEDAKRLRDAFQALGIQQAEAAKRSKLSPSYINDVLANINAASITRTRRALTPDALRALAKASDLRISADYLLGVAGAPMYVAENFNTGLVRAVAAFVAAEMRRRGEGDAWSRDIVIETPTEWEERLKTFRDTKTAQGDVVPRYTIDGEALLNLMVERQLEDLRAEHQRSSTIAVKMSEALRDSLDLVEFTPAVNRVRLPHTEAERQEYFDAISAERLQSELEVWIERPGSIFRSSSLAVMSEVPLPRRPAMNSIGTAKAVARARKNKPQSRKGK